jgi:hypothetical protein
MKIRSTNTNKETKITAYFYLDKKTYKAVFEYSPTPASCRECKLVSKCIELQEEESRVFIKDREVTNVHQCLCSLVCRGSFCTELKEISNIEATSKFISVEKTQFISPLDIVNKFCNKFCPLKEDNFTCKDTLNCPFHEILKDKIITFNLDFDNDK